MKNWKNSTLTGFTVGVILPPLACYIFCLLVIPEESPIDLLIGYAKRNVLTHVISLSVLINLAVFFVFLQTDRENSARGVIGATLLYALIVLILKFL